MPDLQTIIESIGYLGIAGIVFAESGLFIGAFLPGDSLLFTAGFLASQGIFDIRILAIMTFVCAVAGDSFGYAFGRRVGPHIFKREDSLLFHREHLIRAQKFYEKHGGKTIIIARFMPFVRTFAPILAGVGRMDYSRFLVFNVTGGFLWAIGLSVAGYILGNTVPGVDHYLLPIVLAIIAVSLAPTLIHVLRDRAYRREMLDALKTFVSRTRAQKKKGSATPTKPSPDYRNIDVSSLRHIIPLRTYSETAAARFAARFRDKSWFKTDVPLRSKTTFRLGGPADFFLTPQTLEDMREAINACHELTIPLFILGGGSNVLCSDKGWRGAVLQPANTAITINNSESTRTNARTNVNPPQPLPRGESIEVPSSGGVSRRNGTGWVTRWQLSNTNRPTPPKKPETPQGLPMVEVTVGAGTSLQLLVIKTHQEKLVGLESFFGIPAKVGGAVRNNAHGGPDNFDRYVKEATLINLTTGNTEIWTKEKFQFSYDHSVLLHNRDWMVWEVTLVLPVAHDALWQQFDAFYKSWHVYKTRTQTAAGTAGCVFKNIDPMVARAHAVPVSAGALIDQTFGLGTQLRSACISPWHGNFFHHGAGDGSADDMLSLINFVREEIKQQKGIDLELEVELVGF